MDGGWGRFCGVGCGLLFLGIRLFVRTDFEFERIYFLGISV